MVKLIYKNLNKIHSFINYSYLIILLTLYIFFIPSDAMAGIFDPPATDKSVEYLGIIFGNTIGGLHLGTSTQTSAFLGNLFEKINGIVVAIATVILLYTSILSVVNTAQDGEVMGKKWSSVWIPLRSSIGLLLLAPIPGSGYSLIQVTVMWIVLNGIGAADTIWNLIAESVASGINVVQNDSNNSSTVETQALLNTAKNIGPNILRSLVCVELLKKYIDPDAAEKLLGGSPEAYFTIPQNTITGPGSSSSSSNELNGSLQFGFQSPTNGYNVMRDICGKIIIQVSPSIEADMQEAVGVKLNNSEKNTIKTAAFEIKKMALISMMSSISNLAYMIAKMDDSPDTLKSTISQLIDNPSMLSGGVLSFQGIMSSLNKEQLAIKLGLNIKTTTKNLPATLENMKATGWLLAGGYHYVFNQTNKRNLLQTAISDFPNSSISCIDKGAINVENPSITIDLPSSVKSNSGQNNKNFSEIINKFYSYYQNLNNATVTKLFNLPEKVDSAAGDYDFVPRESINTMITILVPMNPIAMGPFAIFLSEMKGVVDEFIRLSNDGNIDPILIITHIGQRMMQLSETLWIAFTAAMFVLSVLMGAMSGCLPMLTTFLTFIIQVIPVLVGTVIMIWGLGALLGVYVPLVPFIIFTVTVIGWFISVVEAIVAAPIVALGIILPSQEELGSVKHAIEMIANIFLKPMLIVIGLILSGKVFRALILFVTTGFKNTTIILNNPSFFSWLCVLWIYTGFIIALVNKSYSLIYHLPDRVLKWIGVAAEPTDTGMIEQSKASYEKVTGEIKNAQSTSTDAVGSLGNLISSTAAKKLNAKKPKGGTP